MTDPSDDLHETRLRAEIGSPAADNPNWGPGHNYHASNVAFLLRRLDESRAESDACKGLALDATIELQKALVDHTALFADWSSERAQRQAAEAEIQRLLSRLRDWGARLERISEIETVLEASEPEWLHGPMTEAERASARKAFGGPTDSPAEAPQRSDTVRVAMAQLKEWSCPTHGSFVLGADGLRHCGLLTCPWVGEASNAPQG